MNKVNKEIWLIKSKKRGEDEVYKVSLIKDKLYFLKIDGKEYFKVKYDEKEFIESFLRHKGNFTKDIMSLKNIKVDFKKSVWIGEIWDEGEFIFYTEGKEERYRIHPSNKAYDLIKFFKEEVRVNVMSINEELGSEKYSDGSLSEEAKRKRLEYKRVHKILKVLNNVALISLFWLMLYPKPYVLAMSVGIIVPIIAMYFYIRFNEFVEFDVEKDMIDKVPNISSSIILGFFIMTRSMLDFRIIYTNRFCIYIGIVFLVILSIVAVTTTDYKINKLKGIWIALSIFCYIYGAFVFINCNFDDSMHMRYRVEIMDKSKSSSSKGGTRYYIEVEPWGTFEEEHSIRVPKWMYENSIVGNGISIYLKDGLFGVQWFTLGVN